MYSIIIPVYKNADSIEDLLETLTAIDRVITARFDIPIEGVFVVDGSPDDSYRLLNDRLSHVPFSSQLLLHAKNFGSFSAIRTGLKVAKGPYFGMMAADLQEPPELLVAFLAELQADAADIVVGTREEREDPVLSRFSSNLFWRTYKAIVMRDIPVGGVDLFGCNRQIRDELLKLEESHSSLVGLVYWLGFRRIEIPYRRGARKHGRSSWTWRKKIDYFLDSIFSFTDLPIRLLTIAGILGIFLASALGLLVLLAKLFDDIPVSGYTTTILVIVFFGALNTLGIGLVGHYAWRTYENTKKRPLAIVQRHLLFQASDMTVDGFHLTERE